MVGISETGRAVRRTEGVRAPRARGILRNAGGAAYPVRQAVRLLRYIWVMFPPAALVPIGIGQFFSLYFALQALAGTDPLQLGWRPVVAAVSCVLWMLLVRLQDDIADADADIRLGRAGDPRYRDRPIVRGDITVPELRVMYLGGTVLLFGLNLSFGLSAMFVACVVGVGITWLGFHWFFIPALAHSPTPLAYLARKALTITFGLYALAVFVDDFGAAAVSPWAVPLLLAPCAAVAAWETARKIRIPEDETEYATYSKVLGWQRAALLPVPFVALSFACLAPVARTAGLGWAFPVVLGAAGAIAVGACLRFRLAPTRKRANLRPYAQLFGAVAHGGLTIALVLHYGVVIR